MSSLRAVLLAGLLGSGGCAWVGERGLDFSDCFRGVVGVGLGLAVDAQVTDFLSPGLGVATYSWNYGWFDREVHGGWIESDVINTPRLAYEAASDEYMANSDEHLDAGNAVTRLALSSLNLPNERWIRRGGVVQVEHFALFNFFGVGEAQRAGWMADLLVETGDVVMTPQKSNWQRGWVEAGATVAFLHARAGFNPLEFVDFAAGLVGFDPAGDDGREPFYRLRPIDEDQDAERRFWDR